MPNDPLIPQPGQTAHPAAAPATLDAETLQRVVAEHIAPLEQRHTAELNTIREQNESLQRELVYMRQQTQNSAVSPVEISSDESLTSFMANPDAFINAKIGAVMDQRLQSFTDNLVPIVDQVNTGMSATLISQHRDSVDRQFGSGTFDERFKPLLDLRIKQENQAGQPLRASDGAWMEAEMKAIKGELFDDLHVQRETHAKAVAEGREKETTELVSRVTTNLGTGGFGNGFFTAESTEPTPEQQAFLDTRARVMGVRDKKLPSFEEMRDVSKYKNIDEYRAAHEGKPNGSGELH